MAATGVPGRTGRANEGPIGAEGSSGDERIGLGPVPAEPVARRLVVGGPMAPPGSVRPVEEVLGPASARRAHAHPDRARAAARPAGRAPGASSRAATVGTGFHEELGHALEDRLHRIPSPPSGPWAIG